jgi:hypothetical protein
MIVDYRNYALFDYNSTTTPKDAFVMGEVVKKKETGEIGVIIQVHDPNEFRVDVWGNCSSSEIETASPKDIPLRAELLKDYLDISK